MGEKEGVRKGVRETRYPLRAPLCTFGFLFQIRVLVQQADL